MATAVAPASDKTKKDEGKVVKPKLKRKLEVDEIVSPKGVPKILNDLSGVKFSSDNKKNLRLLLNTYAAWGRTVGKNYEFEEFVIRLEKLSGAAKVRQMLDAMRRGEEFVDLPETNNNDDTTENDINIDNNANNDNNNDLNDDDNDNENHHQVYNGSLNFADDDNQLDGDDFDAAMNYVATNPLPPPTSTPAGPSMEEKLKEMERKRQQALERRRQGGGGSTWRAAAVLAKVDEEKKDEERKEDKEEDKEKDKEEDKEEDNEEKEVERDEKKDESSDIADIVVGSDASDSEM